MAYVTLEDPVDGVALLRMNRPDQMNALDLGMRQRLAECFTGLTADADVRAIVITGNEKAFAAGADLREAVQLRVIDQMLRRNDQYWKPIAECPKPVIAAVMGFALGGGCELALHADIIIAGESAQFGQPEVRVGIMPGAGGTQRLMRAVGKYHAMKMLMTGTPVSAQAALAMGLASEVVPDANVVEHAFKMAKLIAAMPPLAIASIKEVVNAGQDVPLSTALMLERKAFQLLFDSEDQKEGMQAFLDKRRPVFRGR